MCPGCRLVRVGLQVFEATFHEATSPLSKDLKLHIRRAIKRRLERLTSVQMFFFSRGGVQKFQLACVFVYVAKERFYLEALNPV